VDRRGFAIAIARPELRASALAGEHPAVAATDAAVVEALVSPRLPEAAWRYWHDADAVAALVDKGAATAAILCSPVSVAQTRAAAFRRRDELALHLDLVRRSLHRAEHADGRRRLRVLGQAGEREGQRRVVATLVVHHDPLFADVGDAHDLRFAELAHHDAHLA